MGLKIADLLKWKGQVELKDAEDNLILDDEGKPVTVYLRVIGDQDFAEAYKIGRVASAEMRKRLRDPESNDYKERIGMIDEYDAEDCIAVIKNARQSNITAEAHVNVERPDAVKLEEVAVDADAASLEEQEKLDAENARVDEEYQKAIDEYIETRTKELDEELRAKPIGELRHVAKTELANILALTTFMLEVQAQKMYRACFNDKAYKQRSFDTPREFKDTAEVIRNQIITEYAKLELGPEEIKN